MLTVVFRPNTNSVFPWAVVDEEQSQRGRFVAKQDAELFVRTAEINQDLLAALKRAERDLLALMGDDQSKIDPAFARERIGAAIAKAEGRS